jgi:hypothetical protein
MHGLLVPMSRCTRSHHAFEATKSKAGLDHDAENRFFTLTLRSWREFSHTSWSGFQGADRYDLRAEAEWLYTEGENFTWIDPAIAESARWGEEGKERVRSRWLPP